MALLVVACSFNAPGQGVGSHAGSDEGTASGGRSTGDDDPDATRGPGTSNAATAADMTAADMTANGDASTSGTMTAAPSDTTDASTSFATTGSFDCDGGGSFSAVQLVAEAVDVVAPMQVVPAWGGLMGMPDVAYSSNAGEGSITFEIDLPCDRTYFVWGLVWDQIHGVSNCSGVSNADRLLVSVDDGAETSWAYGCQGCANPDAVWRWTITTIYQAGGCVLAEQPLGLNAGTHTIRFRNEEAGSFDPPTAPNVAAIAAIAISDDPAFDPSAVYPP